MFLSGLLDAFLVLILSVTFNIGIRILSVNYHIESISFVCVSIFATSLVLLIFSGPGRLVKESFKNKTTWIYGFCAILAFIVDVSFAKYMTATEISLFSRITIPFAILVAYIFLKRKPTKADFFGMIFIVGGLIALLFIKDPAFVIPIIVLTLLLGLLRSIEFMLAETHSESGIAQETGSIRDKARVVGFVFFITSMLFLIFTLGLSYLNFNLLDGRFSDILSFLPKPDMFIDKASVVSGLIWGATLSAILTYCNWAAIYKLKSENLLAIMVFIPVLTMFFEWLTSFYPPFAVSVDSYSGLNGQILLLVTIIMTIGSGVTIFYKLKKQYKREDGQTFMEALKSSMVVNFDEIIYTTSAEADYEIIKQTLGFTNGNHDKAAELLGVTTDSVRVLEIGRGLYAFKDEASVMISQNFRDNVISCDFLTGLKNRAFVNSKLKELCEKDSKFVLFFLDLNKFKPINDKHGHEVGDLVLKEISNRLKDTFYMMDVARLGGDEFVLIELLYESKNIKVIDKHIKSKIREISDVISSPLGFEVLNEELEVGVAIGFAIYPENGKTPEEIIEYADKSMYKSKTQR